MDYEKIRFENIFFDKYFMISVIITTLIGLFIWYFVIRKPIEENILGIGFGIIIALASLFVMEKIKEVGLKNKGDNSGL